MIWQDHIYFLDLAWIDKEISVGHHIQDDFLSCSPYCATKSLQVAINCVFSLKVLNLCWGQQTLRKLEILTILHSFESFLEDSLLTGKTPPKIKEILRYVRKKIIVTPSTIDIALEETNKDYSKHGIAYLARHGRRPARFSISVPHDEPQPNEEEGAIICDWCQRPVPADQVNQLQCHHVFHTRCIEPIMQEFGSCPLCELIIFRLIERLAEFLDNVLLLLAICNAFGFILRYIWS